MPGREADQSDLILLSEAARAAGAVLLDYAKSGAKVWDKGGTPVTEADHASNALLLEQLAGARPDYGWLSEETLDTSDRQARRRLFVVDPLDGTISFIKKKDDFTVALAVIEDGQPRVGVVYNPTRDELYAAVTGGGATLNGAPIRASTTTGPIEDCRMVAARDMFEHPLWKPAWPKMNFMKIGSIAYRLALVAAGAADATVALSTKSDWDIAAGEVIAREAGVKVTDHQGAPFLYNRASTNQISLLAAPEPLYGALLERLSPVQLRSQKPA